MVLILQGTLQDRLVYLAIGRLHIELDRRVVRQADVMANCFRHGYNLGPWVNNTFHLLPVVDVVNSVLLPSIALNCLPGCCTNMFNCSGILD
jgi:hypothetical protein